MTTTNDKIRSVFLTAMLVMSVFAGTAAFAGSAAAANTQNASEQLDTPGTYWQGQSLGINVANAEEGAAIHEYDSSGDGSVGTIVREIPLDDNGEAIVSTSNLEGQYVIADGSGTAISFASGEEDGSGTASAARFTIASNDFGVQTFSPENVTSGSGAATEVQFDSNRADYTVNVSSPDLSQDFLYSALDNESDLSQIERTDAADGVLINASTENTISPVFTGTNDAPLAAGEYDITFEVRDTGQSETRTLNVTEAGDMSATTFTQGVFRDERGDNVEVTVNLSGTSEADVYVGSEDVNYRQRVDVTDGDGDGQVTLVFNTYEDGMSVSPQNSDDSASFDDTYGDSIDVSNSALAAGSYSLNVTSNANDPDTATELAVSTLSISQRSTDGAQSWVAPGSGSPSEPSDVTDVVSQSDTVSQGDWAVAQFDASGIYGADADNPFNADGLGVNITEENPGANAAPEYVTSDSSNVEVIPDAENNTVYVLVDTGSVEGTNFENAGLSTGDWNATFYAIGSEDVDGDQENKVAYDDANYKLVGQSSESVSTTFTVEQTDVEINGGDDIRVPQGEVNISGTTNLAPGTSLTLETRSSGNFLKTESVEVGSDGTFETAFDFSDISNGTEFTASTRGGYSNGISGVVDDTVEVDDGENTTTTTNATTTTETTTTTTETTTTAMDTTTETTTEETTETTTESDGGIPGFGIGVALVAFVAAALLALRRSN